MERRLAAAADIPPGSAKPYTADGLELLICNVGGSFYTIEDVCTHDGGALDQGHLNGPCITCPRHGATFDVRTGEATLPAILPVMTFATREEDGEIIVEC